MLDFFIGEDIKEYPVITSDDVIQSTVYLSGSYSPTALSEITFERSPNTISYKIAFERLDNFLAYMGGLMLAIFVIIKIILGSYHCNASPSRAQRAGGWRSLRLRSQKRKEKKMFILEGAASTCWGIKIAECTFFIYLDFAGFR